MKRINIFSTISAYINLELALFQKLMNNYGVLIDNTNGIKDYELEGIEFLIKDILKVNKHISLFNNYYLGYSIPQIGKEFDLLRFGESDIVNIEIKTESTFDKILKQQENNKYYLSFLSKDIHIYTYISNEKKLYKLKVDDSGNSIIEVDFADLCNSLSAQKIADVIDIDSLFNPSDYLVSPFNSTDKFINGEYFLTQQQGLICDKIQKQLSDDSTRFIALTGGAGTGKTLLTYHIAKKAISEGAKVLILHCGQLNDGHNRLKNEWNWNISMAKYTPNIGDYDLIIVDETQRMYPFQYEGFIKKIADGSKKCIFSYDEKQYLRNFENDNNIKEKIEIGLKCTPYKLTNKIRTNKEVASFIKQLFDSGFNSQHNQYPNIELIYSNSNLLTKSILCDLSNAGWKTPNYTSGTCSVFHYEKYASEDRDSAHSVIGQEFNNVAVVIDTSFSYDENGKLKANNKYYSQSQMLYQIITRTRKKLCIVVMNNEIILNRCIDILNRE